MRWRSRSSPSICRWAA
ncbi:MAG: hypothetical protein AB7O65_10945 [Candidatus Korobacteraceae bacterium]